MNQIYWMFGLIPESVLLWLYYSALTAGVVMLAAGWLVKWFPGINAYKTLVQLVGLVLTAGSLYLLGGYGTEVMWRERVAEMQKKVDEAQEQAVLANRNIETKVEVQTKVVREKGKDIIKYVDREVVKKEEIVKYIEQCPVPKEIIDLHNQATELNKAAEGKK
jgi:hypothetical protein